MQEYAEKAVISQMTKIQKSFDNQWKNRYPWGNDPKLPEHAMIHSERYASLKKKGLTHDEIVNVFNTKTLLKLYTYSGITEIEATPMDSIAWYLKMLQTGFMAMEAKTGYIRAWVGGINHKYFK